MSFIRIVTVFVAIFFAGCSHGPVKETVTLKDLQNHRVAIAEIRGAKQSQSHVEVAFLNEILDYGRFEVIDRLTVQKARADFPTEQEYAALGKAVGADYIFSVDVKRFEAVEHKGYDKVVEEDSLLIAESGERKPIQGERYVKVKSIEGKVELEGTFFDVQKGAVAYRGTGEASATENSRNQKDLTQPYLGKLNLLERLAREAVTRFFEGMPK